MNFDENKKKAVAERQAGAKKVDARIKKELGDGVTLTWTDLTRFEDNYGLNVSFGGTTKTFMFKDENLSDYPMGSPPVDATIDSIRAWASKNKR